MRINTALILCAGFGKRLNPITLNTPKPLLEIKDISMLQRCINLIEKLGIQKILINTFYLKDQFSVFLNSKNFNLDIKIIEDGEHILDTGGGIQNMIKDSNEKDFIIFNPDTVWSNDYKDEILKMEKMYFSEKLGIQKIVINTFYLKDQFSKFLDNKNLSLEIKIIEDGEHILDTGGGIQNMIKDTNEKDFLIFNPDTIWSNDYKDEILKMEEMYFSKKLENILLLTNKKLSFDKKLKGDFNLKNNLINKGVEKEFIYIGCQIINKKLFIKEKIENYSILKIWNNLLDQKKLFGYESQKDFYHLTDLDIFKKLKDL